MTELKPCPFCGGEVELIREKGDQFEFVLVSCKNCNATIGIGGSDNKRKVTKAWNTRPNPWHTGTPTEEGWYLCKTKGRKGSYLPSVLRWNGEIWASKTKRPIVLMDVVEWQRIEPYKETRE